MPSTYECYGHSRSLPADQRGRGPHDALKRSWDDRCQKTKDPAQDPVDPSKGIFTSLNTCNGSCGMKCDLRSGMCGQTGNIKDYIGTKLYHPEDLVECHRACLIESCNGDIMADSDKDAKCNSINCGFYNKVANAIAGREINPVNCEDCGFFDYMKMIFGGKDQSGLVECSKKLGNPNISVIFLLFIWIGVLLY